MTVSKPSQFEPLNRLKDEMGTPLRPLRRLSSDQP